MNRPFLRALCLCALAALLACAACTCTTAKSRAGPATLRGQVKIYGSEPHNWVGIETPEGKIYALEPPERATELWAQQGLMVECTVELHKKPALFGADGRATLISWQPAAQKQ